MPSTTQPPDKYTLAIATLQSLLESYVLPTLPPPIAAIITTALSTLLRLQPIFTQLTSLLTSLVNAVSGSSAESTALVSTAIMIVALYVSLRVFNYMRRMVVGWIIFGIKVVVVLVGVQVVIYVNQYGWERAIRDAGWWGGIVWGFVEEVLEGGKDGGRVPKGTRSRGSGSGRGAGQYGREQVPVGGRTRWS